MVKIDLHVHTEYSPDAFTSIKEAIYVAKKRGLDGIAITDHNTIAGVKEAQKIAKELDFLIIPGEEISTKEGHVLALGINKRIKPGLTAKETIDKIHKQKGLAIAAHPYGVILHHHSVRDLIKELNFDAVEVFNSTNIIENKKAIEVARELNLVQVAGSDAHISSEIGRAYTIADCNLNVKSFLAKIKQGNVLWIGKRSPLIRGAQYKLRRFYSMITKEKSL